MIAAAWLFPDEFNGQWHQIPGEAMNRMFIYAIDKHEYNLPWNAADFDKKVAR